MSCQPKIFVLTADTTDGVVKHDLIYFTEENPEQDFDSPEEFYAGLWDQAPGVRVATMVDANADAELLEKIQAEYGIN